MVGPHHLSVMVLWSPWGVHTCKGRNWAEFFNPEVPSGSVCLTCLWPLPRQQPIRLSDRALITDHQAQWTINLNQGHHHEALLHVFWHFLWRNSYQCFPWADMYKEQGGEIPLSALFVTCASGFREERQTEADRASFNTLRKKKNCKSCPSETCQVNEIWHANSPPQSILSKFLTEVD